MAKKAKDKSFYLWALARISIGLVFLWAFFDKMFGLGFSTCRDTKTNVVATMCEKAWANGGSPTTGFLKGATKGPLEAFYQNLAGNGFIDLLFMSALLAIGVALILGIGMKIATLSGTLLLLMMWSAVLPPDNNPLLDDHIIYSLVLVGLLLSNDKQRLGLRGWWVKQSLVKRFPVLE